MKSTTRNWLRVKFNNSANVLLDARICCVKLLWNYMNILNKLSKVVFTNLKLWCFRLHFERDLHLVQKTKFYVLFNCTSKRREYGLEDLEPFRVGLIKLQMKFSKKQTYQCICGMKFFFKLLNSLLYNHLVSLETSPMRNETRLAR